MKLFEFSIYSKCIPNFPLTDLPVDLNFCAKLCGLLFLALGEGVSCIRGPRPVDFTLLKIDGIY